MNGQKRIIFSFKLVKKSPFIKGLFLILLKEFGEFFKIRFTFF